MSRSTSGALELTLLTVMLPNVQPGLIGWFSAAGATPNHGARPDTAADHGMAHAHHGA
jgi:hypothetical protein